MIFTVALVKTSRTTGRNKADKLHIMHIIRLLKQVQQVCCQFLSEHHRDGQMFQSLGLAITNDRSPTVTSRDGGMTSSGQVDNTLKFFDPKFLMGFRHKNSFARRRMYQSYRK